MKLVAAGGDMCLTMLVILRTESAWYEGSNLFELDMLRRFKKGPAAGSFPQVI